MRPVRKQNRSDADSAQALSQKKASSPDHLADDDQAGLLEPNPDSAPPRGGRHIRPAAKKTYGWGITLALWLVLIGMIVCLWALFISGPARIHDEEIAKVQQAISQQVPDIQGLQETEFEYVTWQGYTDQELYWFDSTGAIITTRELSTLNYNEARAKAASDYGMDANTIFVAYGYSGPVYQLESENKILMLDYDTLDWVYERGTDHAGA